MKRRFAGGSLVLVVGMCAALLALTGAAGAAAPVLTMGTATNPSYTTVEVTGEINAEGEETFWNFQVSSDGGNTWEYTNLGGVASGTTSKQIPGTNEGGEPLRIEGEPLYPGVTYQVRLHAERFENGFEEFNSAGSAEFTTPTLPAQTATIEPVTGQSSTTAHFVGHINPNAPAGDPSASTVHWHFHCEPIACPSAEAQDGPEGLEPVSPGSGEIEVQADATGLEPNFEYHVTLVTTNNGGSEVTAGPVVFTTGSSAPSGETIPAFALTGGTPAQVAGRVNPHNSPTTWWIEWGPTASYGSSTPHTESAGSGGLEVVESRQLGGLSPDTTYHFQIVAKNVAGDVEGGDMTFRTPRVAASGPSGTECPNAEFRTGPSAELAECRAYELVTSMNLFGNPALPPPVEGEVSTVAGSGNTVLWVTLANLPGFDSSGQSDAYLSTRTPTGWEARMATLPGHMVPWGRAILDHTTGDLSRLIWSATNVINPEDPDPTTAATAYRDLYRREPDGSFQWLSRGSDMAPAAADIPNFSTGGASADGLTVLFGDNRRYEPDAPAGGLYIRSGGSTSVIKDEFSTALAAITDSSVSADASIVAIGTFNGLYVYERSLGHALFVAPLGTGNFLSVSADGSKVLFSSSEPLTADDQDASVDIYEYDIATRDINKISGTSGGIDTGNGGASTQPVLANADGSTVYFISTERLDGTKGVEGKPNLYLAEHGAVRFAARVGQNGLQRPRFTGDGGKLLFESPDRLTAYDNSGHMEIYLYAPSDGGLICASCRPSGAPPSGNASFGDSTAVRGADEHGERIFFQTGDPLLPRDKNVGQDVYEFDVSTGTPSLISTGLGAAPSVLYGNGADGHDVFFGSTESMGLGDSNVGVRKLFDARVGGGFAQPTAVPRCEGEGCRGKGSEIPADASPTTANFSGPGDPKLDRKRHKKHRKHKKHRRRKHRHHHATGHGKDKRHQERTGR